MNEEVDGSFAVADGVAVVPTVGRDEDCDPSLHVCYTCYGRSQSHSRQGTNTDTRAEAGAT